MKSLLYKILYPALITAILAGCIDLDGSVEEDLFIVNLDGTWEVISEETWDGAAYSTVAYPRAYDEEQPLENGSIKAYVKIGNSAFNYYHLIKDVPVPEGATSANGLFKFTDMTAPFTINEEGAISTKYSGETVSGTFEKNGAECTYTLTVDQEGHTFKRKMTQIFEFSFKNAVSI